MSNESQAASPLSLWERVRVRAGGRANRSPLPNALTPALSRREREKRGSAAFTAHHHTLPTLPYVATAHCADSSKSRMPNKGTSTQSGRLFNS